MPTRPRVRVTHTLAHLELSPFAYDEIKRKLLEADYGHVIDDEGVIDMSGIGVVQVDDPKLSAINFITTEKKSGNWVVSIAFFNGEDASAFHGWAGALSANQSAERERSLSTADLLDQISHWANQITEAGPIRALLAERNGKKS